MLLRRVGEKLSQFCSAATTYGPCLASCNSDFVRRAYETDETVFLYIVRVEYPSLYDMAFEKDALLVVPSGISLATTVTLHDVENHLIYETHVPGEYMSVSGKRVAIDGNELVTGEGFEEERRVRIVVSEEIEDAGHSGRRLRVLQVSRPLSGGVCAPDEQQHEMDTASMRKYVAILRASPEVEVVFRDLDAFIAELQFLGTHAPDGFERVSPSLEAIVLSTWHCASQSLLSCGAIFNDQAYYLGGGGTRERHRLQVCAAVEGYLLSSLHGLLYPWLQRQHAQRDALFAQALRRMAHYSAADVGLGVEFHAPLHEAVEVLQTLPSRTTPLDKLLTLKAVAQCVFRCVQCHLRGVVSGAEEVGDVQLATDDLVTLLALTLIRASPSSCSVLLDLSYIRRFHFLPTSTSASGYFFNSFMVAADFLMSRLGLGSLVSSEMEQEEKATRATSQDKVEGGEGGQGEEDMQRALARIPPPRSDVALLHNVIHILQERGEAAAAQRLIDAAMSFLSPCACGDTEAASQGTQGDESEDDEGPAQKEKDPGTQEDPSTSQAAGQGGGLVTVFGDAGVRRGGDEAQTHVLAPSSPDDPTKETENASEGGGAGVVRQAAAGQQFYTVLLHNGELQTWGLAENGVLGQGEAQGPDRFFPTHRPSIVQSLRHVRLTQVSCGSQHVLAVSAGGELYAWGDNRGGQLGLGRLQASEQRGGGSSASLSLSSSSSSSSQAGAESYESSPRVVGYFKGQRVVAAAAGRAHSLALTEDAQVYSWGRAQSGRLGRLHPRECRHDAFSPGLIEHDWSARDEIAPELSGACTFGPGSIEGSEGQSTGGEGSDKGARVVALAAGWSHSLAVLSDGRVMTWGAGLEGRLGHGDYSDAFAPREVRALSSPYLRVVQAAAGYGHSVFLTQQGEVFTCGYNKFGQLGLDAPLPPCPSIPTVHEPSTSMGGQGKRQGAVEMLPRRVMALRGVKVVGISAGENHTAARSADGRVYTWGLNLGNQCGHGRAIEQQSRPKELAILRGASQVSCGASHTMIVM